MSTSDAVARECAWLTTAGDTLPALPSSAGGPFQVLQAYWPRTPAMNQTGLYVLRPVLSDVRASSQRIRPHYEMTLRCVWPVITAGVPLLETAQRDLDNALDLLFQRIRGPVGDKSHGGRFLSAGENPRRVEARGQDVEQTMAQFKTLRVDIVYSVDDYEISG